MDSNPGFTFTSREILGKLHTFPDILFLGEKRNKVTKKKEKEKEKEKKEKQQPPPLLPLPPNFSARLLYYIK